MIIYDPQPHLRKAGYRKLRFPTIELSDDFEADLLDQSVVVKQPSKVCTHYIAEGVTHMPGLEPFSIEDAIIGYDEKDQAKLESRQTMRTETREKAGSAIADPAADPKEQQVKEEWNFVAEDSPINLS